MAGLVAAGSCAGGKALRKALLEGRLSAQELFDCDPAGA